MAGLSTKDNLRQVGPLGSHGPVFGRGVGAHMHAREGQMCAAMDVHLIVYAKPHI